jgi:transcriptional regulator of acetoin/glycerol metabolism
MESLPRRRSVEELAAYYAHAVSDAPKYGGRRSDVTDEQIRAAVKKHAGSVRAAAAEVGLSYVTVYNRLKGRR